MPDRSFRCKNRTLPTCILNKQVIALNEQLIICDHPAEVRTLTIKSVNGSVTSLHVPFPRLLVAGITGRNKKSSQLWTVAVRKKGPINGDTLLFHAPLMSICAQGRLTHEGDSLPSVVNPLQWDLWGNALFSHAHSNVRHDKTIKLPDMTTKAIVNTYHHTRFWRELSRIGAEQFPGKALVSRKQKLNEWLEDIERGLSE